MLHITWPTLAFLSLLPFLVPYASAADWPQFRGPHFNGFGDNSNLPAVFDKTTNLIWKAKLPGPGAATPIIAGNHIFLSTLDQESNALVAMALDLETGKTLWKDSIAPAPTTTQPSGKQSIQGDPSPVTNGKIVIFVFKTGDVAAYDFQGNRKWSENLQKTYGTFSYHSSYASSPLLFQERLYIQTLHRSNDSYLLCLDPETGRKIWKSNQTTEARDESKESYATPLPYTQNTETEILTFGADQITSYNPASGTENWRWTGYNKYRRSHFRVITSPVPFKDKVFLSAPRNSPLFALQIKGKETEPIWKLNKGTPDGPTPAVAYDKLFVLAGQKKTFTCLDANNGRVLWTTNLPKTNEFYASPTIADHKVFIMDTDGQVIILSAGIKMHILHRAHMGGSPAYSSVVPAHNRLYIRTATHLYCIGKP